MQVIYRDTDVFNKPATIIKDKKITRNERLIILLEHMRHNDKKRGVRDYNKFASQGMI